MARRGPKPKPVSVHKLQGTFQPSRHNQRAVEPEAPGDLAELAPPTWLTKPQRAIWRDVLSRAPRGVLRAIDRELLAAYVELVDRHQRAAEAQAKLDAGEGLPLVVRGGAGLVQSPFLRIMNTATLLMVRLQSEFGFTPVGRAGLGQPTRPRDEAGADGGPWSVLRRFPVIAGGKTSRDTK